MEKEIHSKKILGQIKIKTSETRSKKAIFNIRSEELRDRMRITRNSGFELLQIQTRERI